VSVRAFSLFSNQQAPASVTVVNKSQSCLVKTLIISVDYPYADQ